jgi:hypothetical protein
MSGVGREQVEGDEAVPAPPIADRVLEDLGPEYVLGRDPKEAGGRINWQRIGRPVGGRSAAEVTNPP